MSMKSSIYSNCILKGQMKNMMDGWMMQLSVLLCNTSSSSQYVTIAYLLYILMMLIVTLIRFSQKYIFLK